jgi:hypothetical protein
MNKNIIADISDLTSDIKNFNRAVKCEQNDCFFKDSKTIIEIAERFKEKMQKINNYINNN